MRVYGFWNNKGGTGKTNLAFQSACFYASAHPSERVLVIDVCPQANISELFLGGLVNNGSDKLLRQQGKTPRASIGGYFELRLPAPYEVPTFQARDYITTPRHFNRQIPKNIDLICGDPLLELQANAMSTLANTQIPGTNTWLRVVDWLRDLLDPIREDYETAFIDANPSFSLYTQIALSVADSLVLPVMADDSSRRAVQNSFSLIHGLKLPSPIYATHNFASRLTDEGRELPTAKLVVKNRITQYMGDASAYAAVLRAIEQDVKSLLETNPEIFDFARTKDGFVSVRDFQTVGVVAAARGCPINQLSAGKMDVKGRRVQVNDGQRQECVKAIKKLVASL